MSDDVINPKHYKEPGIKFDCIDLTRKMSFCQGNAFKYVWRAGKKEGAEKAVIDLKKAMWYLADLNGRSALKFRGNYDYSIWKELNQKKSMRFYILRKILVGKFNDAFFRIAGIVDQVEKNGADVMELLRKEYKEPRV